MLAVIACSSLQVDGRYGAYGAPVDAKVTGDAIDGGKRLIDISFTSLSPGALTFHQT